MRCRLVKESRTIKRDGVTRPINFTSFFSYEGFYQSLLTEPRCLRTTGGGSASGAEDMNGPTVRPKPRLCPLHGKG